MSNAEESDDVLQPVLQIPPNDQYDYICAIWSVSNVQWIVGSSTRASVRPT